MSEPVAWLNGSWIAADEMRIPVTDAGFVLGTTVAEQIRTFRGQLFSLDKHLARLQHSLAIIQTDPGYELAELGTIAQELAAANHRLLAEGDDLGLSLFVTPGPYATYVPGGGRPTVGMHTYPLPFGLWAHKYEQGEALAVTDIRQVPGACWPIELKCRSRMHYYLADLQARQLDPGSRALLLDLNGFVTEASTANLVIYRRQQGLISPPQESILPGVTVAVLRELTETLQVAFSEQPLQADDVESADEVYLTSTSPCILPVTRVNKKPIGGGKPGDMFQQLLAAWTKAGGVDIPQQARRFARR